jgi:hypothetical protein
MCEHVHRLYLCTWLVPTYTHGTGVCARLFMQAMTSELGKSCQSGEAVLILKKYISKCNLDNERLKDEIAANKQRDDFLSRFRCGSPAAVLRRRTRRRTTAYGTKLDNIFVQVPRSG